MTVSRFRQLSLDLQLILWDLPLWVFEDIIWKIKTTYKKHDWIDDE
jgi:hypothetical protein